MKILSIKCVASSRNQMDHIMDSLNEAGYPDDDISVSFPTHNIEFDEEEKSRLPNGLGLGAALGSIMGAVIGGLAGFGVITIPGAAPFITGGPVLTLLGGAVAGATLAGILGGLIELTLPNSKDESFHLYVQATSREEAEEIQAIMREEGATHIHLNGQQTRTMPHHHQPQLPQLVGH